jgi:AcrR family transcriptional regulator
MLYAHRLFSVKVYVTYMEKNVFGKSRRDEYAEATRQALLSAGHDIFAKAGYQAAGIEAISQAARVTRGAFYHHFADKKALFDAVAVALQAGAAAKIQARGRPHRKVWDKLRAGVEAYLDVSNEPAYRRIVIQEAPAVLGDARFREIEEAYPMALLTASLNALQRQGEIEFEDIDLLSRMIDAMICKLVSLLPQAEDPEKLRANGQKIISKLLDSFRPA